MQRIKEVINNSKLVYALLLAGAAILSTSPFLMMTNYPYVGMATAPLSTFPLIVLGFLYGFRSCFMSGILALAVVYVGIFPSGNYDLFWLFGILFLLPTLVSVYLRLEYPTTRRDSSTFAVFNNYHSILVCSFFLYYSKLNHNTLNSFAIVLSAALLLCFLIFNQRISLHFLKAFQFEQSEKIKALTRNNFLETTSVRQFFVVLILSVFFWFRLGFDGVGALIFGYVLSGPVFSNLIEETPKKVVAKVFGFFWKMLLFILMSWGFTTQMRYFLNIP